MYMGAYVLFVVLQPQKCDNGFLSKISGWLHPYEPQLVDVAVRSGAPFFTLDCPEIYIKKEGGYSLPWDKIISAVGRCASRMLIPERINIPAGIPVSRFVSGYFSHRLLLDSVATIIRKCRLKPSDTYVAVIDSNGLLSEDIEQFVVLSSCIKIITNRRSKYEELSLRLMKKYGAVIMIADDYAAVKSCNFLVSTYAKLVPDFFDGLVFCQNSNNNRFYSLKDIELPYEYEKLLPPEIDRLDFAGALYELCGVKKLVETKVRTFKRGEDEINLHSLCNIIN